MPNKSPNKAVELPRFWFPHGVEGYALGEVLHHDQDSENMHVQLLQPDGSAEKTANFAAHVAKPVNPKILDGVHDNTQLMHLHEPSLLFNLRYRYGKDLVYTYTGTPPPAPLRMPCMQCDPLCAPLCGLRAHVRMSVRRLHPDRCEPVQEADVLR